MNKAARIAAVIAGERFRRRDWQPLFQTFTGGGIAIFYIFVFFSFQIYELSGQGLSVEHGYGPEQIPRVAVGEVHPRRKAQQGQGGAGLGAGLFG